MMTKLRNHVMLGVAMELKEANKNHPPIFNSLHEGYGVLAEEVMEAQEHPISQEMMQYLLYRIQKGGDDRIARELNEIEERAIKAACEYIQVAAMARKMRGGLA